jgi:FKBP-type peptidyl-prolyl cis-trans isomerase
MVKVLRASVAAGVFLVGGDQISALQGKPVELESEKAKVSYGLGFNLGARMSQEMEIDVDAFAEGLRSAVNGKDSRMTPEEIATTLQEYQQKQIAEREAEANQIGDINKAAGTAFLEKNATKEGVTVTESGLQYEVVTLGTGTKPAPTDTVEVHYRGTLLDGTEFDSSYARGETVSFPLNGVIPGWTEALQLMPVGSTYKLYIPSGLAYGPGGAGGAIGPNATLIFDVELIGIQ